MARARVAVLAAAASVSLIALAGAPAAIAAPTPTPTKTRSASSKPSATRTKKPSQAPAPPPAAPVQPCKKPVSLPASQMTSVPWPQQRLDFTSVWPLTRGQGVKVAVVDSGINAKHPQLVGQVRSQVDLTHTHNTDCVGHGTEVAGIIAARDMRNKNIPFVGVAPGVKLMSVKMTDADQLGRTAIADGIEYAVNHGAQIINVSAQGPDTPELRRAVQDAKVADALIVAAAGNTDPNKKKEEQQAYPASYPGVLSVGSVDASGSISNSSNTSSKVDIVAPGDSVISTVGDGYQGGQAVTGTSFAAPFVTGVAALVKANKPGLTATELMNRLTATADGGIGQGSGAGMVNPKEAVTAIVTGKRPPNGNPQAGARPIDIGGPAPMDHHTRNIGGLVALGTLAAALLVFVGGVILPLGTRRDWRPGRPAPPPDDHPADADPA